MQQHPPCSVGLYTWGEAANSSTVHYVRDAVKTKTTNPKTTPPETRPSFQWVFHFSPQACKQLTTRAKTDNAFRLTRHQVLRSTDAMNVNSVGCIQLHFRLNRACGRTCKRVEVWPFTRPAFPRGIKSSCGRPGACQSKAMLIMAQAEFGRVNPQGSMEKSFKSALVS